jgi:hypothetical protein
MRELKIRFYQSGELEWANLSTEQGYYVAEVHRCSGEGRRKFRLRARSIMEALERCPTPLLTTSPDEC